MHWATISFLRKVLCLRGVSTWRRERNTTIRCDISPSYPFSHLRQSTMATVSVALEYISFFLLITFQSQQLSLSGGGVLRCLKYRSVNRVSTFLYRPPWMQVWGLHAEWDATRPLCISRDLLRAFYWLRHYRGSPTPDAVKRIFHFSFGSSLYFSLFIFLSLSLSSWQVYATKR